MSESTLAALADNISILLVHTSHPGNIGAAARAMKTMNLEHLILVCPKSYPHPEAVARAAGADDILHHCEVVGTLSEAIADAQLVIGTSARMRHLSWPQLSPRACGQKTVDYAKNQRVALVFGREKSGLSNDELQLCHYHVQIPCNPDYASLNLASAVQVLAYEINIAMQACLPLSEAMPYDVLATGDEVAGFQAHLASVLLKLDFLPKQPRQMLRRLHRLFNRAQLQTQEIHILRGILNTIDRMQPSNEEE